MGYSQKIKYQNTWIFMVGVLEWENKQEFGSFDKRGRVDAKLLKFYRESGVPESQITYIKDKEATTAYVREAYMKLLSQTSKGDQLIFYYCGHGYKNNKKQVCFVNYSGAEWTVNEIVRTAVENFKGSSALFLSDCCNSGGLVDECKKYANRNFAALTAVVPNDVSTGNWTYSNALLYGFQGKSYVDLNQDKKITLSEIAQYIDLEMAIVEGQKSYSFVPGSLTDFEIKANVALKTNPRVGEHVWVRYDKDDYLGFITATNQEGKYNVRYYSYLNNETEWLESNDLRTFKVVQDFKVGNKVQVYDDIEGGWFPAKVLKKAYNLHYIHYDGYGAVFDVWVGPNKIKKP